MINLKWLKMIIIAIVSTFISIIIALGLTIGAYKIPTDSMESHVLSSYKFFIETNPNITPKVIGGKLDTHTDAIMLLTASYRNNDESIIKKSLLSQRYTIKDKEPDEVIYTMGSKSEINEFDRNILTTMSYARYWHGYVIILKPLLLVVGYDGLRIINGFILFLSIILLWLQYRRLNEKLYFIPLLATLLFINPISIVFSLQFTGVITITLIGLLVLARYREYFINKKFFLPIFFSVLGGVTAYIDLLTYPLITLGIPLTYWLCSTSVNSVSKIKILGDILLYSIIWGIGYSGLWGSKWIFATYLTDNNIIYDAYHEVIYRTSTYATSVGENISYINVLKNNLKYYWINFLLLIIVAASYLSLKKCKIKDVIKYSCYEKYSPFIVIAFMPFIWYFMLQNHSYIHSWFTYRTGAITIYTLVLVSCLIIKRRRA